MATHPNVFLVGMMGCGKTTVGRQVAARLGFGFRDTDEIVERASGADISWIFDLEGEAGFREREERALDEATSQARVVVATGGGAVLLEANRRLLRERGVVVYLRAAPAMLLERTRRSRHRPLLQVDDVERRVDALCREREPLYRAAAHVVVEADGRPAREAAANVLERVRGHAERAATP